MKAKHLMSELKLRPPEEQSFSASYSVVPKVLAAGGRLYGA